MSNKYNRRRFLRRATSLSLAATGVGYFSSRSVAESRSANEKLDIAIIGVGGRGAANTGSVSSENIVALCDIDERNLAKAAKKFPKARKFHDLRRIADMNDVNAVVVSTTDHTHAAASILAMRTGKHVYCEKPLAHTVHEARTMRLTYLKTRDKLATQMGTQIHASANYRRVVELVQSGAIGAVREAHIWCNRKSSQSSPPSGSRPVPDALHWDLWVGPAPFRDFQKGYHPGNLTWNRYWDIGNGIIGDMGSHLIDLSYWALELQFPSSCEAFAPPAHPVIYPTKLKVVWEHPRRGDGPHEQALKVVWYDGHAKPDELLGVDISRYGIGTLFVGDKGRLLADYGRRTLLPKGEFKDFEAPEAWIPDSVGHHREWIHAAKNDPPATLCNFDYSGKLIEHNLLGTVSHRVGKKLEWDHEKLRAKNAPEASKYIRKEYRKGWGEIFVTEPD